MRSICGCACVRAGVAAARLPQRVGEASPHYQRASLAAHGLHIPSQSRVTSVHSVRVLESRSRSPRLTCSLQCFRALLTPPKHDVCACVKALVAVATGFVAIIVIYGADYLTFLKFYLTGYALYGCEGGSRGAGSCVEELTAHMYEWLLWLRGQDGCIDSFIRSRFNRPHPRGVAAALSRPATQTHQSPTRWSCQRMSS